MSDQKFTLHIITLFQEILDMTEVAQWVFLTFGLALYIIFLDSMI